MTNIVVIAHNSMKPEMVTFLKDRENWLWGKNVVTTGLTGKFLEEKEFKVPIKMLSPGREGGYQELQAMVENDEVQMVLFFRDPNIEQDYVDEVEQFLKSCNRANIPLATNPASAELLILGYIRRESAEKLKEKSLSE